MPSSSDHGAVRHHATFGNHHDPLTDEVAVGVLVLDAGLVDDAHAAADAGVLVHDRLAHDAAFADADRRHAAGGGALELVQGLVVVGPEHQAVVDAGAAADA